MANVNGIRRTGAATGNDPVLSADGSDTNIGISVAPKGTGVLSTTRAFRRAIANPVYSASITPDASAGNWQRITVTDGVAFAVNAPSNPPSATQMQELWLEFLNSSGGAMGAVTLNAAFVLTGGAVTYPANTKKRNIAFVWDSTVWVEQTRSVADY